MHANIRIRLEGINPGEREQRLFDFCAIASRFYLNKSSSIFPNAHADGLFLNAAIAEQLLLLVAFSFI